MKTNEIVGDILIIVGILAVTIGMLGIFHDITTTLHDIRAINSEMRDTLNCQTWPNDYCSL